eukprot:CAMPEP_0119346374 /NCGR_PEP_ID=MMETSP1333-20130426/107971_1 /TAXON_ID=418940 /ORGANISM="Scyphosphaera apsteinii, Strain RCC1455" /LENGTH=101 /DNA_ID=CAMNT_0007358875 /DNA_START=229 /DNA_END=534 /DNA_ORIENTATION=+
MGKVNEAYAQFDRLFDSTVEGEKHRCAEEGELLLYRKPIAELVHAVEERLAKRRRHEVPLETTLQLCLISDLGLALTANRLKLASVASADFPANHSDSERK